jgi:hypothetical protein
MLSQLPGCLIVDCEDGSRSVEALKVSVNNYGELKLLAAKLKEANHPYPFVAIDTIDKVEEWCEKIGTQLYKNTPQGKNFTSNTVLSLPNGGGYMWLRIAFHEALEVIKSMADCVILVGHIRDKMIDQQGKEVSAKDLDLTGKIRSIVCAYADAIGYVYRDKEGILKSTFNTTDTVTCGARQEHLRGKTFNFSYPEAKPDDWKQIYLDLA